MRKKGESVENACPVIRPHDAMIHEKRLANAEEGSTHGYFPGGVYIYEKRFIIPETWREKCIYLEFEGIYKNSSVSSRNGKKYPYLIGDFMWTSWDYLGEARLGAWSYTGGMPFNRPYPWLLGGAGVIDILGIPDASCRYAAVVWDRIENPVIGVRPVNHPGVRVSKSVWRGTNAIESWAWKGCDGNKAIVEVYGKGVKAEEQVVKAGDRVYVDIAIKGENDIVEANADTTLTCTVTGGVLLGFGSANPCTEERYDTGTYTTYFGRTQAAIYAGKKGEICVKVSGGNLHGETQITVV